MLHQFTNGMPECKQVKIKELPAPNDWGCAVLIQAGERF